MLIIVATVLSVCVVDPSDVPGRGGSSRKRGDRRGDKAAVTAC